MPLRIRIYERQPIGAALRRFKKLLQWSGLTKGAVQRQVLREACEVRRRARLGKRARSAGPGAGPPRHKRPGMPPRA